MLTEQVGKPWHTEAKRLASSHTASKRLSCASNPGCPALDGMVVPSMPAAFPAGGLRPLSHRGQMLTQGFHLQGGRGVGGRPPRERRPWRCPPLERLPHSCLLLLPRCCPRSSGPLGIHRWGAGTSPGRSAQCPEDVGVGGFMETLRHTPEGIVVDLRLWGAHWLVILRNSVGISQSFLFRAGFEVFPSRAQRVGKGAGCCENV